MKKKGVLHKKQQINKLYFQRDWNYSHSASALNETNYKNALYAK